jgi:hypothetical protein
MRLRLIPWALWLTGLALGVSSVIAHRYEQRPKNFVVAEPDRHLVGIKSGSITRLSFPLCNHSDKTVRIVGLSACCNLNCRFESTRSSLFDVPPQGQELLECELQAIRPGPFEGQFHVFVDDGSTRQIVLNVQGESE